MTATAQPSRGYSVDAITLDRVKITRRSDQRVVAVTETSKWLVFARVLDETGSERAALDAVAAEASQ